MVPRINPSISVIPPYRICANEKGCRFRSALSRGNFGFDCIWLCNSEVTLNRIFFCAYDTIKSPVEVFVPDKQLSAVSVDQSDAVTFPFPVLQLTLPTAKAGESVNNTVKVAAKIIGYAAVRRLHRPRPSCANTFGLICSV